MSSSSSNHTRPAYSLTSSEWRSIRRFGVLWGIKQYNLNPKGLAEVCFKKGDAAYKKKDNSEGNEFMNMVKELVKKFPDVFLGEPEVVEVSVAVDESKAEAEAKAKVNTAKKAQSEGLDDVARCLLLDTDPNTKDQYGQTLLHATARVSKTPIVVKALLDAGANPNVQNEYGQTPLHLASQFNSNPTVVKTLLDAGADLNARDKGGRTPLHWAASHGKIPAVVKALLDAGADLNGRDENGGTPLHQATRFSGTPAVVQALLDAGADLHARDKGGLTPLYLAKHFCKKPEVVKLLILKPLNQRGNKTNVAEDKTSFNINPAIKVPAKLILFLISLLVIAINLPTNVIKLKEEAGDEFKDSAPVGSQTSWPTGGQEQTAPMLQHMRKKRDEQGRVYILFRGKPDVPANRRYLDTALKRLHEKYPELKKYPE